MKFGISLVALVFASSSAAAEAARAEVCRKGDDERVIEIAAPGTVGAACDVVYRRDGGMSVNVPYHANADANFCRARAAELAATLIAEGFDCSAAAPENLEEALAGGPATVAATTEAQTSDSLDVQLEKIGQPPVAVAELTTPPEPSARPEPIVESPGDPVQLAGETRPIQYQAPRPPRTTGAGRLVGAPPSIEDIIDVSVNSSAAEAIPASAAGLPTRSPDEIIRALIAANVAAWNEGNLDAYMGGYAASADLMMIKGSAIVTGWDGVRDEFEAEISAAGEMGRMSVGEIDVNLTSHDVATAVGRYAVRRASTKSAGVVTLVMKQQDGRWRIVQETRIADVSGAE